MSRRAAYRAVVAGFALAVAAWVFYNGTRPYLRCPDGHCPDPGTREYIHAVERNIATAPVAALIAFVAVLALGGLVMALFLALRPRRDSSPVRCQAPSSKSLRRNGRRK